MQKLLAEYSANTIKPPRQFVHDLSRDLDAICQKCLDKDPKRRYQSASSMAEDLRRFLDGEATKARPIGTVTQLARWASRRPATAALISVTLVSIMTLAVMGWWSATMVGRSLSLTRSLLYVADVRLAGQSLKSFNSDNTRRLLERHIPGPREDDPRGFAWHYIWNAIHSEALKLDAPHEAPLLCLAISPHAPLIAAGDGSGSVWLWDTLNGEIQGKLPHPDSVRSIDFSPNGETLVTTGHDGCVRLWNVDAKELVNSLHAHGKETTDAQFSPDGTQVATCGRDGQVKVWSVDSWELQGVVSGHTEAIYGLRFTPDGKQLISGGWDDFILVTSTQGPSRKKIGWSLLPRETGRSAWPFHHRAIT